MNRKDLQCQDHLLKVLGLLNSEIYFFLAAIIADLGRTRARKNPISNHICPCLVEKPQTSRTLPKKDP